MKKKIVLWGSDENEKKLLIGLELLSDENKVRLYSFPEEEATEEFYNQLMNEWREDREVVFPENHNTLDRPLSMTDDLLPENIRVERTDLITRAKAEWHFVVLSGKLYDLYKSELEDLKQKVQGLDEFNSGVFEEMKAFWSKVSEQARERNLFRDHADKLKEITNDLFGRMKELRSKANEEFASVSKENKKRFEDQLEKINEKIENGLGLKPIFDELKDIQSEFNKERFTKSDRSSLWNTIDGLFKKVKLKKYGDKGGDNSRKSRLERRYQGLLSAIGKMEKSIARDKKDIDFQNRRVDQTQGQLEMQIRQAKAKMVQERIDSKKSKLDDMLATRVDLEKKLEEERKRQEAEAAKQKVKEKKEEIKEKIASEITEKKEVLKEEVEKLEEAAKSLNIDPGKTKKSKKESDPEKQAPKEEGFIDNIKTEVSEMIEDVVDTVKAVSEVVEDNVESKADEVKSQLKDKAEEMHLEEKLERIKEKAEHIKETIEDSIEEVIDTISGEEKEKKKSEEEE